MTGYGEIRASNQAAPSREPPIAGILRYGATMPPVINGQVCFCCPDPDVINVFQIHVSPSPDETHSSGSCPESLTSG